MGKKNVSGSIAFKLAVVFIFFAVFQSILLASLMVSGGVLKQAKANQYSIFSEKVNGRSDNLENQMKNIWTNLDYDMEQISRYFETMEQDGSPENSDAILEELAPLVMDTLFRAKTTGAFLVMPGQGTARCLHYISAIIIRTGTAGRIPISTCWWGLGMWRKRWRLPPPPTGVSA